MFKLPGLPSPGAEPHELADFAELLAWVKGTTSAREIIAYLGRLDDNDHNIGCDDNDDENADELDEVMNEIERRKTACGDGYPFELESEGTVLRYVVTDHNHRADVYRYLLLSTRLNMKSQRVHAGIDGTALLEEISARVLQCYLGSTRARSIVFGITAAPTAFEVKVNDLCQKIGEGGNFRNLDDAKVQAKDDKLDAVAWVPFSDSKAGQIVVFGQCKTGSNWEGLDTQLQPTGFIKRWMSSPYLLDPIRALCISEAANRSRWSGVSVYSGLLLDRCRLVDFCESLDSNLLAKLHTWNAAAMTTVQV